MGCWSRCCLIFLVLGGLWSGCAKDNAWTASRDKSYKDDIQEIVRTKIDEQSEDQGGAERWAKYKSDEFQRDRDFAEDPRRAEIERKRKEAADRLLAAGPVSLEACLIHSLEFNDLILASRASVRSVGGDELIAKSRFLPRLTYDLTASVTENFGKNVMMGFTATQTLLEFGKDNPVDVALRDLQRQALFSYEEVVAGVLWEVRLRFFTILLRQQQLAERQKLRDEFTARYERMVALEEKRRVLEADVLTARLNVLNEESRINALEKEILRQKMDLLKAIGLPVEMIDLELAGSPEDFGLSLGESVETAFRRSTAIAQSRAWLYEQDRIVRQIVWEYLPTVRAQGGYQGSSAGAGADLATEDNVYGAGGFGERYVNNWNDDEFFRDPRAVIDEGAGWYGSIDLTLPIFSGLERTGRYQREKSILDERRHLLSDTIRDTEISVGKDYQTVLEQVKQTEILRNTVRISKERLRIQERLKEDGLISDNELETFRERFFRDQDNYFEQQIQLIQSQEQLRQQMRYFDTFGPEGEQK